MCPRRPFALTTGADAEWESVCGREAIEMAILAGNVAAQGKLLALEEEPAGVRLPL